MKSLKTKFKDNILEEPLNWAFFISKKEMIYLQQNTNTLYTFLVGGGTASVAFLLGGIDKLITALVIFMITDFILGLAVGTKGGKINSKRGFKGLLKKGAMLTLVIVAYQLDIVAGSGDAHFLRNAMIMFLIAVEGISITENVGHLGVPIPKFLSDRLEQLKNDSEKKSNEK